VGQKTHPYGFRLGITKDWWSKWYSSKEDYSSFLLEDLHIRNEFKSLGFNAAISKVEIIRKGNSELRVLVYTARPGMLLGKKGAEVSKLEDMVKNVLEHKYDNVKVDIREVKHSEIDAELVGQNVAQRIEQKTPYKRAIKQAISRAMRSGAQGIKIQVSGRLGGAEIARTEWFREGRVPLQTLNADIDYSEQIAKTKFGVIGVKVWVYKGEAKEPLFFTS